MAVLCFLAMSPGDWLHALLHSALKPRPNDGNMSIQHIATLLGATGYGRLTTLFRHAATCWVLLAQIWPFSNLSEWYTVQHRSTFVDQQMLNIVSTCWNILYLLNTSTFVDQQLHILARSWNGGRGNVAVALCFELCRRYYRETRNW